MQKSDQKSKEVQVPTFKSRELQEEQDHFHMCQRVIRENISRYEKEYEERHIQVQKLFKALSSGDGELYNQLMAAANLEAQAGHSLRKNKTALIKPYFGRIDYIDKSRDHKECVYIGKNGIFQNKTDVLIADWRAPISAVYYENELGPGEYSLPDESKVPIELHLKRTYDVEDGVLNGYYDSDVASNDDLLVKYLSRNKDVVLGEIISTIQKEQNSIIRETPYANLIVQGVAGSGKTTVAMHRISYLLYNYKDRFQSNEFCIVGSNDLLLNYITSGLPELDVPDIKHMRMDQLLIRLCEKAWTGKCCLAQPDETAMLRCGLDFMKELEYFLMEKRLELVNCQELKDKELGIVLSSSSSMALLRENPHFSVYKLLSVLDERVKTRIRFLMSGEDRDRIQGKLREFARYYKKTFPRLSALGYYEEFLMLWLQNGAANQRSGEQIYEEILKEHLERCRKKLFDIYDAAALALIHYRIFQKGPNEEFGLLFLDEAQDFGLSIYYALKTVLPDAYFTIMGDVSQNINYETGLNDWYELTRLFLTGSRDKFLLLKKSYRNTIEISEYAGKILEKASFGRYKIEPVIRHGLPVQEEFFSEKYDIAQRIAKLIPEIQKKGYVSAAVICKNESEAKEAGNLLRSLGLSTTSEEKEITEFSRAVSVLPVAMVKGLEFDVVVLWDPDIERCLESQKRAKLLYVAATRTLHELYVLRCR